MRPLHLLFLGLLFAALSSVHTANVPCDKGLQKIGKECADEDECKDTTEPRCRQNAKCFNTYGSYYCQCVSGYRTWPRAVNFTQGDGLECKDEDECKDTTEPRCPQNAKCFNTIGSYYCQCVSGYRTRSRAVKFTQGDGLECKDIKECSEDPNICGLNAICNNTIGSYFCTCSSGFVASNGREKFNASEEVKCNELKCNSLLSESLSVQVPDALNQILKELHSTCVQKGVSGEDMLQILVEALEGFLSKMPLTNTKMITALFEIVENTLPLIGQLTVQENISLSFPETRVEMLVQRRPRAPRGLFTLSTNSVQFDSHWETAVGNSYQGFVSASLFEYGSLERPHNNSSINTYFSGKDISTDQFKLNSKVVTIAVTNPNTAHLEKPITLKFSHLQEKVRNMSCVFWNTTLEGGAWSNNGCSVVQSTTNYTVCSCSHLSSFAVLMALYEIENVFELQLITWIGLSLSLICLLICILTFWLVRSIQSTRTTIHLHLCISLFIADFIFLVGISQTGNQVGCAVVAGLLHFFFLAVFCWMCLEGVQLFRMVVLVFNTTLNRGYLMAAGYGVPALIVIISASVNYKGYGTPRYCWLNLEDGFIWSFFAPVCVIIVVNAVFFLITVSKLAQKFNSLNPDLNSLRKIKTFTITAIAQLCVLGIMWIFGCFQFDEGMLGMSYVFTILNSLQGVLVFIMHCLLSKQVRDEYIRFLTCLTVQQKKSYSEFSTNQSSKSQVSKSVNNTGELRI